MRAEIGSFLEARKGRTLSRPIFWCLPALSYGILDLETDMDAEEVGRLANVPSVDGTRLWSIHATSMSSTWMSESGFAPLSI